MKKTQVFRRAGVIAATALLAASCSGSDNAASTTTDDLSGRPGASVSDPDPAVTDPPVTDPVVTDPPVTDPVVTDPPVTDPVVTEPPTTVADTPEGEVVAAIEFFEEQWKTCLSTLPACDQVAASVRRQGEEVGNVQSNALRWNQNDYRASNIEALDYRADEVTVNAEAGTAVAVVCVVDPVALTEADGTVVDDNFYSSIVDWELQLVDGEWTSTSRTTRDEAVVGEENNLCA